MNKLRSILIMFGNLFDPGWYADKINTKLGVYEWAKKSPVRKWEAKLTGWKWWTWQIVGGIIGIAILEYLINFIGLTMLPWR